jgi:CheY-like chemotaxis protein
MANKILLADDSVTIQKVVQLTFSGEVYEVTCVSNGSVAMEKVREIRPDVVLLDIIMPGENGYDVCEAIKKDPAVSHTPVLLLSGTFEPFDRQRAARIGADGHLTKPFESQVLISKVTELLEKAKEVRESIPVAASEVPEPPPPPAPPAPSTAPGAGPEPEPASVEPESFPPEVLDEIVRRVAERIGEESVRDLVRDLVPDLAERLVRERIRQIEEDAAGTAEE